MVDLCLCHMEADGPIESVRDLVDRIKKQDKEDLESLFGWFIAGSYYGLRQEPYDLDDDSLYLDFTSRWRPPEDDLEYLSRMYPDLVFSIQYRKLDCGLYGTLVYRDGKKIEDIVMNEHQYMGKYDREYQEIAEFIKTMDYQEFLKNFKDEAEKLKDHRLGRLFEELLLQKIKDEDLLLFINHRWRYIGNSFKKRIEELLKKEE